MHVSVDAAKPETYARIRRGGIFSSLLKNFEVLKGLRERGEISKFLLRFVVQEENFREMQDFVRLGTSISADKIIFSRLRNWGTYEADEFKTRDIAAPEHAHFRSLKNVLRNPCFRQANVSLGDLSFLAPSLSRTGGYLRVVATKKLGFHLKRLFFLLPSWIQRPIHNFMFS